MSVGEDRWSVAPVWAGPDPIISPWGRSLQDGTIPGLIIISAALAIGLMTARHYGITIDEFNTDDYGPKALAWYTSLFKDRSHFETVESPLWYYGPWFQMVTAFVQSLAIADPLTVRHAMTFLVGLSGIGALLPLGRWTFGRWAGTTAVVLCLTTGYLYGSLFFTPIDVPFLAAMSWATLAAVAMARTIVPRWLPTLFAGLATGLAIATRTGGIITHAYLIGAMGLCGLEACLLHGGLARPQLWAIAGRTLVAIAVAWLTAIALWPWLQIGNPFTQFWIAYAHFTTISTSFPFQHWGAQVWTDALPRSYIPAQLAARLPITFLFLLAAAVVIAATNTVSFARSAADRVKHDGFRGLRVPLLLLARERRSLVIWMAVLVPISFLIVQHATLYDGIRHILFVIPMLALLAGSAVVRLVPLLWGYRALAAIAFACIYIGATIINFRLLHPLEYTAMNAFVGGTHGAYGNFELDYWSAAGTEALRRLEHRLDVDAPGLFARNPPSVVVCIPYREQMAGVMVRRPWKIEVDPAKGDFVIETERSRCAKPNFALIDEVDRADRPFAWTFENPSFHLAPASEAPSP